MVKAISNTVGQTEFEIGGKDAEIIGNCLSIVGAMHSLLTEAIGERAAEVYKHHVINDFDKLANTTVPTKGVS